MGLDQLTIFEPKRFFRTTPTTTPLSLLVVPGPPVNTEARLSLSVQDTHAKPQYTTSVNGRRSV